MMGPVVDLMDVSEPELIKAEWSDDGDEEEEDGGVVEHEGHHTCLVCSSPLGVEEVEGVQPWKEYCKWGQQQQQPVRMRRNVSAIFLLRKLLHYPSDKCAELLGTLSGGGVEPGGWVSLCRKCSQLVLEALQAHEEIRELEAKIGSIGSQLRAEIGRSRSSLHPGKLIRKTKADADGDIRFSVQNTIRQFYQGPGAPVGKQGGRRDVQKLLHNKAPKQRRMKTLTEDVEFAADSDRSSPSPRSDQHSNNEIWSDDDGGLVGPDADDPLYIPEMNVDDEQEEEGNADVVHLPPPPPTTRRSNRLKGLENKGPISATDLGTALGKASTERKAKSPPMTKTFSSSTTKCNNNYTAANKSTNGKKGRRLHQCQICHKHFGCSSQFQIHMRIHSTYNNVLFPCPICAHPASCPNTRQAHVIRSHPKAVLKCSKCDDFATTVPNRYRSHEVEHSLRDALEPLKNDEDDQDQSDSFRCKLCCKSESGSGGGGGIGSWKTMTRHLKLVHAAQLGLEFFPCTMCPYVASRRRNWKLHCLAKHPVKKIILDKKGNLLEKSGMNNNNNKTDADNMPAGGSPPEEHFHEDCDDDDDDPLFIPEMDVDEQGDDEDDGDTTNVPPPPTRRRSNRYKQRRGSTTPKAKTASSLSPTTTTKISKSISGKKEGTRRDSYSHECHICHACFRSTSRLRVHMKAHSTYNDVPFLCPICGHSSSNPNTRLQHLIRLHPKAVLACPKHDCDFSTDNPYTFGSHETEHKLRDGLEPLLPSENGDDSDSFRCKFCGESESSVVVGSWVTMSRHLKLVHSAQLGLEFFPCTVCSYVSSAARHLKVHCLKHHQVRVLRKEEVEVGEDEDEPPVKRLRRRSRESFKDVYRDAADDDDDEPEATKARVSTRSSRTSGAAAVEKYKCKLCHCKFRSASQFRLHSGIHSAHNNVLFLCPICGKAGASPRTRFTHLQRSHPSAALPCPNPKCDFTTTSPLLYTSHETEHKIREQLEPLQNGEENGLESSFRCKLCDANTVGSWEVMVRHMKRSHSAAIGTQAFPCTLCDDHVSFSSRSQLKSHSYRIHHVGTGPENKSTAKRNPKPMLRPIPHKKKWKCSLCPAAFSAKTSLGRHARSIHGGNRRQLLVECPRCEFKAAHRRLLFPHMRAEHGELFPHACDSCGATFPNPYRLQVHQQHKHVAEGSGVETCPHCGAKAKNKYSLKSHLRYTCKQRIVVESSESNNSPNDCEKRLPPPPPLKDKRKWERRETEVAQECSKCEFKTTWKDAFATHVQGHIIAEHFEELEGRSGTEEAEEPLARCKLCGKVCGPERSRYIHLNSKHASVFGVQSYQCQYCGMGFNTYRRFRRHANRHKRKEKKEASTGTAGPSSSASSVEKFMCEYCGAPFTSRDGVVNHRKKFHLEETPAPGSGSGPPPPPSSFVPDLKCKFCQVSTYNQTLMAAHLREEHAERFMYKCDQCDAMYQLQWPLTRHKASKHLKKTWKCQYCGGEYSFSTKKGGHWRRYCKGYSRRHRIGAGKESCSQEEVDDNNAPEKVGGPE